MTPIRRHKELDRIWKTPRGWGRLSAVNHTVVGRRFMVTSLVFFAIGGLLAMLIRTQLATRDSAFMEPGTYAQVFTMHGTIMMFLFAIPFFEGLAMYLLPKMLGARDLAFPRMSAYGYWCYLFGGSILIVALLMGAAPDGGWFMYTPLSSSTYTPGISADVWLLGISFVEISAMSAAVEFLVSILLLRAGGMSLDRMPIFAWYMLVVAGMMLVGFPPLILGSVLLETERALGLPFFDPTRGGDPLLWQHLFWLFGHPEVYIIFLPAAGVLSTIIPVFSSHRLVGFRAVVAAIVTMGFLSFGLWVHHMYTTGIPHLSLSFFSIASALVAVPTAVQIFAWFATMAAGRPRFSIPMLHVGGFMFVFVFGGLSGVMLAMVPFNSQVHDTQFVVAHLHYVLVGGFIFPMMAAAYYWLPHMCGRQPVQHLSHAAFWTVFGGFNLTFLGMHLTGLLGMTRRLYSYDDPAWEVLNFISSMGGFVTTIGFALLALDLILLVMFGKRARRDPWGAGTLEWATPMPPPSYAFAAIPVLEDAPDGRRIAAGQGLLAVPRGQLETLGVDPLTGAPQQIVVLPASTFLPLWTAVATGGIYLSLLAKTYLLVPPLALVVVVLFLRWTRSTPPAQVLDAGRGIRLPNQSASGAAPSLWAMRFVIAGDATAFASLLFGAGFLAISAPGWPPPGWPEDSVRTILPVAVGAAIALLRPHGIAAVIAQGLILAGSAAALWRIEGATDHAAPASLAAVAAYAALHAAIGLVIAAWAVKRPRAEQDISAQWQRYAAIVGAMSMAFPIVLRLLSSAAA
ncbi:cytochrome c oxidase subunit I [Paracoccus sediminis]|uniref:cytochrome-c oxidase n=1 Tax=Paracoccus sediminis TaxID=1214787 RepID=A0A238UVZ7_9RHOB|nr:cytochrome c oxidase subunit I [Paracoccus sediminis]TBN52725.1 cytochrome c oxidase subunit I [Paracoccus sediminis]SNR26372.1 cytochrome c oxidase subunit I+III [Paracoccus sediminis]